MCLQRENVIYVFVLFIILSLILVLDIKQVSLPSKIFALIFLKPTNTS